MVKNGSPEMTHTNIKILAVWILRLAIYPKRFFLFSGVYMVERSPKPNVSIRKDRRQYLNRRYTRSLCGFGNASRCCHGATSVCSTCRYPFFNLVHCTSVPWDFAGVASQLQVEVRVRNKYRGCAAFLASCAESELNIRMAPLLDIIRRFTGGWCVP